MRLLFFSNVFPNPNQPTKGTFNLEMVKALAQGQEVRVVSPVSWVDGWRARRQGQPGLGPQRCEVVAGVDVVYPRYYYSPKVLRSLYGWFLWQSVRGAVRRLLDDFVPDAVLGYWAHPDGAVAVRIARSLGVPAVVMVGGSDVLLLARQRGRRRLIRNVLLEADAVVTASRDLRSKVIGLGVGPEKVHVAYRGVDAEVFAPGDKREARRRLGIAADAKALLWVGRMVPVKGLDVLIDACARLRQQGRGCHLYLVGEGPRKPVLEGAGRSRGLGVDTTFVGPVAQARLADWYRAADLTVLPSLSEGVPNVLRESQSCGTPFVASDVGGIAEIAHEGRDRLVPPGDPEALARALAEALAEVTASRPLPARPAGWAESAESLLRVLRPLVSRVRGVRDRRVERQPALYGRV
jgi:glycosyltransferase involved in cell wall biosynthesis